MAEAYSWTAVFANGDTLSETEAGSFSKVIDRMNEGVRPLVVMIEPALDSFPPVVCQVPEDARPIFFRRRMFDLDPNTGQQFNHRTYTAIGYQKTVEVSQGCSNPIDINVKSITWVCPDGSLLVGEGEP